MSASSSASASRTAQLARRSTMMPGAGSSSIGIGGGSGSSSGASHGVDAIRFSAAMHDSLLIPDTVSARGYDKSMPVAFEPEQPRRARKDVDDDGEPAPLAQSKDESADRAGASALSRRSTLPSHKALQFLVQPPPLMHPSLTPSCDLCSAAEEVHPSLVFCAECDLYLCGSEAVQDGLPLSAKQSSSNSSYGKPKACNYRLHRHKVMQGHVRVAASTMMQLEKLLSLESAKPEADRRSRKDLTLQLYALPMRGVSWQYQSLAREEQWIEYDLLTQQALEQAFGPASASASASSSSSSADHKAPASSLANVLAISDQYEVHRASSRNTSQALLKFMSKSGAAAGEQAHRFVQLNTVSLSKSGVRRIDVREKSDAAEESSISNSFATARPNSRPTSAMGRQSAPISPLNATSASGQLSIPIPHFSAAVAGSSFSSSSSSAVAASSSSSSSSAHSPSHASSSSSSARQSSLSDGSLLTTPRGTPRPALARHASMDMQQLHAMAEWSEEDWLAFAKSQRDAIPQGEQEGESYPIYDMERGSALLLVVYHNALGATRLLLQKGYSARALTTWTHVSALMIASMQGNDAIAALLLEHGADAAYKNQTTTLALEYAVKSGCLPLVQRLLELRRSTGALLSYSDVVARTRKAKRSTWIDIAENDAPAATGAGAADDSASSSSAASALSPSRSPSSSPLLSSKFAASSGAAHKLPTSGDLDAGLYAHLMTEALNVPPIQAHTTSVLRFLLDAMLARAQQAAQPPAFELSRYHEWMSTCINASALERVKLLLGSWAHYTLGAGLVQIDRISEDHAENQTDPAYARTILRWQASVDALFFQAVTNHPASEEWEPPSPGAGQGQSVRAGGLFASADSDDDDDDAAADRELIADLLSQDVADASPFALLSFLLSSGGACAGGCANVDTLVTDAADGTQLTPLFVAIRDRKWALVAFLVQFGADVDRRLRSVVLELDQSVDVESMQDPPVERVWEDSGESRCYQLLDWRSYAADECAYAHEELTALEERVSLGLARRHTDAHHFVQAVLEASVQMATEAAPSSSSSSSPSHVPRYHLSCPFSVSVLHVLSAFCFGHHALTIGASISADDGLTISRPVSPMESP